MRHYHGVPEPHQEQHQKPLYPLPVPRPRDPVDVLADEERVRTERVPHKRDNVFPFLQSVFLKKFDRLGVTPVGEPGDELGRFPIDPVPVNKHGTYLLLREGIETDALTARPDRLRQHVGP